MSAFLPLFPLNLVVFPGEKLNLHIFEDRYRQLISECLETGKSFGIPIYLDNKLTELGTEVKVVALHKRYDDGRMDISSQGIRVFKIDSFVNPVSDKLYAGGEVSFLTEDTDVQLPSPRLLELLQTLHTLLDTPVEYDKTKAPFSFQVAHKVGLSLSDEYRLLALPKESLRQMYLVEHLQKIIPVVSEVERTKARIRMNGHFKNLDPLDF
ncbi:LON peptidase substrate-binding domain-containing protein [Arundinibacter roseus]|uniref:Peptidase n=1 Tax=Arundinibacter roseus TaxID=2070510 RepID=A0A4R4KRS4_9BACT|nr:LON peptidase substrate-binding domain-containing protein [Arundinibacter roseus]TDB69131.1 peptidase [Arundinibacter roseus]